MVNEKNKRKRKKKNADSLQKNIPDDVLPQILCKLPPRSICRFRCVCKSWRDLFRDKEFINRTRAYPPFEFEIQHNRILKHYTMDERRSVKAKGNKHYIGDCNYRRCNNLICYQRDSDATNLSVLDLSTQETHVLPLPPSELKQPCFNFEFGLDPCSNEYKVLVWTFATTGQGYYILTLQGNGRRSSSSQWRRLEVPMSDFYSYEKSFATTTGIIYLVDAPDLVSFNLSTEEFRMIQLPPQVFERRRKLVYQSEFWYSLFEYQGCLCWVELWEESSIMAEFNYWEINGMWMLKDHDDVESNTWVKLMNKTTLPMPMDASLVSTTWSEKHSLFSSTPSGEIMITISIHVIGVDRDPYILLYSFLDQKFVEISIPCEHDSRQ